MVDVTPDTAIRIIDVAGVVANGLLGGAAARERGYDVIGFLVLAIASALGGGIMRDLMLNQGFPVALTDPFYLSGAGVGAIIAYLLVLEGRTAHFVVSASDVLVLGCWSATGAYKALSAGLGWLPAILLGVLTAVGGGVVRDVLMNEVPGVFGGHPIYATIAIVSSGEMVLLQSFGQYFWGMGLAIVTSGVLGFLARRKNWQLPGAASLTIPRPRLAVSRPLFRRAGDRDQGQDREPGQAGGPGDVTPPREGPGNDGH